MHKSRAVIKTLELGLGLVIIGILSACSVLGFTKHDKATESKFVAVLDNGDILSSGYGESWITTKLNDKIVWNNVLSVNQHFIALGMHGEIRDSIDGVVWSNIPNRDHRLWLYDLAYDSHKHYVAVGMGGTIVTSANLSKWQIQSSPTKNWLSAITYGSQKFVAVGANGVIISSSDGSIWQSVTIQTNKWLSDVQYVNGNFIAVGAGGTILTSESGNFWQQESSATKKWLYCVAYGNGHYLAVGDDSTIMTSVDASHWVITTNNLPKNRTLHSVIFANGKFWLGGYGGLIASSVDGQNWQVQPSYTKHNIEAIAYLSVDN